jgi:hypothetical protein
MRTFIAAACAVMLVTGAASAKTYQLTYTGKRMSDPLGYKPIRNARKVVLAFESPIPYPKNSCFNLPLTDLTSLTDGADTQASLAASGYILDNNDSSILLCTDASGKRILSWQIAFEYSADLQQNLYAGQFNLSSASTPPQGYRDYDAVVFRTQKKKGGRVSYHAMSNQVAAGNWRYKVLD